MPVGSHSNNGLEQERELIAEIEHEHFIKLTQQLKREEAITVTTLNRWRQLWKPYTQLEEKDKLFSREYAEQIQGITNKKWEATKKMLVYTRSKWIETFKKAEKEKDQIEILVCRCYIEALNLILHNMIHFEYGEYLDIFYEVPQEKVRETIKKVYQHPENKVKTGENR